MDIPRPKVFKLPDGNGGWYYQIQSEDGQWLDTDEEGNVLSSERATTPAAESLGAEEAAASVAAKPRGRPRKRPEAGPDARKVNYSILIPWEDYKAISDYVHWKCLCGDECTRSGVILSAVLDVIRRDRDYREFRKKL